ncbi:YdcF family protein [Thalassotalea atypica]|uniref:YdcF family protein n=1 Tax=Thalassotalea atypica TaxID=2054316 RepID=UPI002572AADD|nr:YdcF family protein [Thalassotalea atypica]
MPDNICIAIFGSKVHRDGRPSGSLLRRIKGALEHEKISPGHRFFVTGGTQDSAVPTEAGVMTKLLMQGGITRENIIEDHDSTDTLDSVLNGVKMLPKNMKVVVCSDNYHVLRITILFRMLGIEAVPLCIESGRPATGTINWLYMWFRDICATVYDCMLLIGIKLKGNKYDQNNTSK